MVEREMELGASQGGGDVGSSSLRSDPLAKLPRPRVETGWGVIGPHGNIWSDRYFDTPEEALQHVRDFWRGESRQWAGYWAVPVKVKLTPFAPECAVAMPTDGSEATKTGNSGMSSNA